MQRSLPVHDTASHGATGACTSVLFATLVATVCVSAVYLLGGTQETSSLNAFSLVVLVTLTSRSICDECIDLQGSFKVATEAMKKAKQIDKPPTVVPTKADTRDEREGATRSRLGSQVAKYQQLGIVFESLVESEGEREDPGRRPSAQQPEDAGVFQQLYLFLNAFMDYIGSFWNTIDFASLVLIVATVSRILTNAHRGPTTQLAAFATMLLWLRMINYLSGFERTAPCE